MPEPDVTLPPGWGQVSLEEQIRMLQWANERLEVRVLAKEWWEWRERMGFEPTIGQLHQLADWELAAQEIGQMVTLWSLGGDQ